MKSKLSDRKKNNNHFLKESHSKQQKKLSQKQQTNMFKKMKNTCIQHSVTMKASLLSVKHKANWIRMMEQANTMDGRAGEHNLGGKY